VVAFGAGAVAGVAGGVYGLGEGLVKGGIKNYPQHIKGGANVGKAILTPVGGATGAIATGLTVAVAGIGAPVVAGLSVGVGLIGGTAIGAVKNLPSSVVETGKQGAEAGSRIGSGLGKVGSAVGRVVGATLGGLGGIGVAVAKGFPDGVELAKSEFKAGVELVTGLPKFAKDTWNIAYHGGRNFAGGTGALGGALVGAATATGATVVDGGVNAVKRGGQWASHTSGFVRGES
jgi:hypothetical protein